MPDKEKLFVETSIQIQKTFSTQQRRMKIRSRLKRAEQTFTSQFVRYEFDRTVLADCILLHQTIYRESTLTDAFLRLGESSRSRHAQRMWLIYANLISGMEEIEELYSQNARDRLLIQLEDYIEETLSEIFLLYIDATIPDLVGCALPAPRKTSEGTYEFRTTCQRATAPCRLPSFLQKNATLLRQMDEAIQAQGAHSEWRQMKEALKRIFHNFQVAKGQKNCWPIGDCIIALEMPDDYQLLTLNLTHFRTLCAAIGKQCVGLEPDPISQQIPRNPGH